MRGFLPVVAGALLVVFPEGGGAVLTAGRFDTRLQVDNRHFEDRLTLEQRGELTLRQPGRGVRLGTAFAVRRHGAAGEAQLYRLFLERRSGDGAATLTVGRTERSDSLGFYTFDGAELAWSRERMAFRLYAGIPRRIDDYRSIEGKGLYGIGWRYHPPEGYRFLRWLRVGWQRYRATESSDRLSWGIGAGRREGVNGHFTGVYVFPQDRLEEGVAQIRGNAGEKGGWLLSWQIWQPRRPWLTFRERFYSLYARGRQSVLRGDFRYRPRPGVEWSLGGRRVMRERGEAGFGLIGGVASRPADGRKRELQFTLLRLGADLQATLWGEWKGALDSRSRLTLRAVTQYRQRRLYGVDRGVGIELDAERMIRADLFVSLFASRLWNSLSREEYRAGARLTWYLDGYRRGGRE